MDQKIINAVFQLNVIKMLIKEPDNERIQRGVYIFQSIKKDLSIKTDRYAVDHLENCLSTDLKKAIKQIDDLVELLIILNVLDTI